MGIQCVIIIPKLEKASKSDCKCSINVYSTIDRRGRDRSDGEIVLEQALRLLHLRLSASPGQCALRRRRPWRRRRQRRRQDQAGEEGAARVEVHALHYRYLLPRSISVKMLSWGPRWLGGDDLKLFCSRAGNESFERVASYGLTANLTVYLVKRFHVQQVAAANIVNIFSGTTNFAPLVGAFLSDAYCGRFRTLAYSSIATFLVRSSLLLLLLLLLLHLRKLHFLL
ncbi:hypothetical protein ZIOFF_015729 [Zingiber officinale]|uniref:Uncharacterized protein n=1 Tax=Zingiber officinale TaxID=94328 RepID=A0A8J5HJ84_ZINOF|nr:hypothetical protein ZIOFF_015729 [Zingiber officinale]